MNTTRTQLTTNIVRHLRHKNSANSNLGGITFVFDIHHNTNQFAVGYAVCNKADNFSKHRGRSLATVRKECSNLLPLDAAISLVDNVTTVINSTPDALLSRSQRILKQELKSYAVNAATRLGFLV
jgi:hypothetical protein